MPFFEAGAVEAIQEFRSGRIPEDEKERRLRIALANCESLKLDAEGLTQAIEAVEQALQAFKRQASPKRKAELVAFVFRHFVDSGDKTVDKEFAGDIVAFFATNNGA